ncbi:MAG: thioredoxin family protein [Eubacteriales bacterium]|nr:thioredoxin family protein [Eubacteriales bacterium]
MQTAKRSIIILLSILTLLVSACAAPEQTNGVPQTEAVESGATVGGPITAKELDALREANETVAVYFIGKKSSEMESLLQANLSVLVTEYAPLLQCGFYTIPIDDYKGAKDILGGNLFGVALFRGQEAVLLSGDSRNDISVVFNRFFENGLVAPDDHGLPIVTYDKVKAMIDGGETFLLYIGRDTCPQCKLFSPNLETALEEAALQTPQYYFYTQDYETAINNRAEGAQEQWDGIKAELGIRGTPSLLFFKEGKQSSFESFNTLFPEFAKSPEEFAESNRKCVEALRAWLTERGAK